MRILSQVLRSSDKALPEKNRCRRAGRAFEYPFMQTPIDLTLKILMKVHNFTWLQVATEALSQTCVVISTNMGYVCTRAIHIG